MYSITGSGTKYFTLSPLLIALLKKRRNQKEKDHQCLEIAWRK